MRFGSLSVLAAKGAILAHSLKSGTLRFKKGRKLDADDIEALTRAGIDEVIAVVLEDDDRHENVAASALAGAVAGSGIEVRGAFTGRVNLYASKAGLVRINIEAVSALNHVDESITLATVHQDRAVQPGQIVATVKIIPFAVPVEILNKALSVIGASGIVTLAPFRPMLAGLIQTELESVPSKVLDKTARITGERMAAIGGQLGPERRCAHETSALAAELQSFSGDILLIAGASAITDRMDILPKAIEAAGGKIRHFGMPVDPGNLLLLADLNGKPVIGMPGCARSPKQNGFDWVLQRLAAGMDVAPHDIMGMGVGGLLGEIPTRPQPRDDKYRDGKLRVGAVILAAGQSRRMGARNKLLIPVDGKPMLLHAIDAATGAGLEPVIVVTGHEHEQIEAQLSDRSVRLVRNPDFKGGLSTSLKAGLLELGPDMDGVLICLGDMPGVDAGLVERLRSALDPAEGHSVIVPTFNGKRGNPVLWSAKMIPSMMGIEGDVGAKHLIGLFEEEVFEVETEDSASLFDIDTPEALAAFEEGRS